MRKVGQDRAAWTSSPPEPAVALEVDRLRTKDSVIETTTVSVTEFVFPVTGFGGELEGPGDPNQREYLARSNGTGTFL